MDPRRGQGFGWSIPVSDGSRRGEAAAAARHVEGLWGELFPQKTGYSVTRSETPGGVRLRVQRGDFFGEVEVKSQARERGAQLKVHGWACSQRLAEVERAAARTSERLRILGSMLGTIALMLWLSQMFVHPPNFTIDMMFLLGGLLVVVIVLIASATGGNVGAWLGEQVAADMWDRATAEVEGDSKLREDLVRWRGLVKNLAHFREVLANSTRRQPFRSPHLSGEGESEPVA